MRCLLLWLIGFSALERAVPRTPRCRPFFELAGGRRLSTITEDNPGMGLFCFIVVWVCV